MSTQIRLYDVIDFNSASGSFEELKDGLVYRIDSTISGYGTAFTPKAASHLIYEKIIELEAAGETETMAVQFSKVALLEILMQDGCEGIRFVKCKAMTPDNSGINPTEDSLVAMGLNINGELIGKEWYDQSKSNLGDGPMPIAIEKGNTASTSKIKKEITG